MSFDINQLLLLMQYNVSINNVRYRRYLIRNYHRLIRDSRLRGSRLRDSRLRDSRLRHTEITTVQTTNFRNENSVGR